jgi:hypothetical protein
MGMNLAMRCFGGGGSEQMEREMEMVGLVYWRRGRAASLRSAPAWDAAMRAAVCPLASRRWRQARRRQAGGGGGTPVKHTEKEVNDKRKCCNVASTCFSLFLLPFLPKILKNLKNSKYKSFSKREDLQLSCFDLFQILLRFWNLNLRSKGDIFWILVNSKLLQILY